MPKQPHLIALLVIAFLPFLGLSQAESRFAITDGKATTNLPFELIDNRVFLDVRLNGRGPFHFILDTGAAEFSVRDEIAQELRIRVEDAGEESGTGEQEVHIRRTRISTLQIGDLQFDDVAFTVFPGGDFVHVFGTKPFDGILGLEVFKRVTVKHDYVNKMLTFTVPGKFNYNGTGTIVPFQRPRQIPVVDAELDGIPGKFGVDTGARSSLLLYGPFIEENKIGQKYHAKLEGITGWGLGGPIRSQLARARTLRIGDLAVHDIVIRLSVQKSGLTTSSAMAGLIGPDILSQFDVTFDYARDRIILEKTANYGRSDSYDRAGVWMGQEGTHFTAVDVIDGGPAAEAGVKKGDTILAIDGVGTENLVLPEVREKIRRQTVGSRLMLVLESDRKRRTAVITLRDLV